MRLHLEMKTDDNVSNGMTPKEARYNAMRRFGNTTLIQERSREIWLLRNLEIFGQDLRNAARTLLKYKAFSAVVIITLALGIGANTAIFTAVNAALVRSMPYPQSSRLVHLWEVRELKGTNGESVNKMEASYPDFLDYQNQSKSFERLAGFANWGASYTLTGRGEPERIEGSRVTSEFFSVLGVSPALGRDFLSGEDKPNAPTVVILSYGLWQRKFGGDPAIVGQTLILDGSAGTVIGVMPKTFQFAPTGASEMWTPLRPSRRQAQMRFMHWLEVIGRLKPDATFTQARAEL